MIVGACHAAPETDVGRGIGGDLGVVLDDQLGHSVLVADLEPCVGGNRYAAAEDHVAGAAILTDFETVGGNCATSGRGAYTDTAFSAETEVVAGDIVKPSGHKRAVALVVDVIRIGRSSSDRQHPENGDGSRCGGIITVDVQQ